MGGDITARSSPGAGSDFRLTLALAVARQKEARPVAAPAPPPALQTEGLRILVAEDNATNRLIVSRMLSSTEAEIAFAEDGRAAVSRALDWSPDVIFMDISMPELDGIEATRRIRAAERSGDRPRAHIIALTANAFDEDRQACIAAGFDAFLTKPLNKADLLGCLTFRPVPRAANGL
jgi:CheY-like chemotaxis protein